MNLWERFKALRPSRRLICQTVLSWHFRCDLFVDNNKYRLMDGPDGTLEKTWRVSWKKLFEISLLPPPSLEGVTGAAWVARGFTLLYLFFFLGVLLRCLLSSQFLRIFSAEARIPGHSQLRMKVLNTKNGVLCLHDTLKKWFMSIWH